MIWTVRQSILLQQFAELVARAHDHPGNGKSRYRKDGETPYITHPFVVALLARDYGVSWECVMALLAHDILEDCGVWRYPVMEFIFERLEQDEAEKVWYIVTVLTEIDDLVPRRVRVMDAFTRVAATTDDEALVGKCFDRWTNLVSLDKVDREFLRRTYLPETEEMINLFVEPADRTGHSELLIRLRDRVEELKAEKVDG